MKPICCLLLASLIGTVFLLHPAVSSAEEKSPKTLKICMLSGSEEYESAKSLPEFKKYLEAHYRVECSIAEAQGVDHLPGVEALDQADVALFFTRRLKIPESELAHVKKYVKDGKPIVGVRTASHGFQGFLEFDKEILGDNYKGHFGKAPQQTVKIMPSAKSHPVLAGIEGDLTSKYSLYKTAPLVSDATLLMESETPESKGPQPATWVREIKGQRVFYTSLGGLEDFQNPKFRRLVTNAIFWTAKQSPEAFAKK